MLIEKIKEARVDIDAYLQIGLSLVVMFCVFYSINDLVS